MEELQNEIARIRQYLCSAEGTECSQCRKFCNFRDVKDDLFLYSFVPSALDTNNKFALLAVYFLFKYGEKRLSKLFCEKVGRECELKEWLNNIVENNNQVSYFKPLLDYVVGLTETIQDKEINKLLLYWLGAMMDEGLGDSDHIKSCLLAEKYYLLSAENGYPYAYLALGDLHWNVPNDTKWLDALYSPEDSSQYYRKAAENGISLSENQKEVIKSNSN